MRDYVRIGFNPRFLRLALAGIGFGGIFLYISSAPVFVMQHLHLGEGGFAWLFIPTIGGMTHRLVPVRAHGRAHHAHPPGRHRFQPVRCRRC